MITFASLFLGLVVGTAPVTVLVGESVAEVSVELDGRPVGSVREAPWTLPVDFGLDLHPHELVAHALNGEGREIGSARQYVNLPKPAAQVEVVLERDGKGRVVAAHFAGASLVAARPSRVAVTFDGKTVPIEKDGHVRIPSHDPEARHVVSVEAEFLETLRSRTDLAFGGGERESSESELTAVALLGRSEELPAASSLRGVLTSRGEALPVTAVDRLPALVCMVRGPSRKPYQVYGIGYSSSQVNEVVERRRFALGEQDRLRFIWPIPMRSEAAPGAQLFARSRDLISPVDGGVPWALATGDYGKPVRVPLSLADAAAAAGLEAAASGSRRAVVLVIGDETSDGSRHWPSSVRGYLADLHVPLFVWSVDPSSTLSRGWGTVDDVSSLEKIEKAIDRLNAALSRQVVVWVKGRYMPQEIALSKSTTAFAFPGLP